MERREREIRYMLDGRSVTVPIGPAMSDDDLWEVTRRLTGIIYERKVTDWQQVIVRHSS